MPTSVTEILTPPQHQPQPPRWIKPALIIFDDLSGPAAIRLLEPQITPKPAFPERLAIVSKIDPETALPDRVRTDDLLQDFARKWGLPFKRLTSTCTDEFTLPAPLNRNPTIIAAPTAALPPNIGAQGGLAVVINSEDLAHAFSTGEVWYRRPVIQTIKLLGSLPENVTPHDLAIHLRPQIHAGTLLVITQSQSETPTVPHSRFNETIVALLNDSTAAAALCHPLLDPPRPADLTIQLDNLQPMIGTGTSSAEPLSAYPRTKLQRAYIGSCRTGSVDELRLAARELHQRKVTIPTIISPAGTADAELLHHTTLDPHQQNSPTLMEIFTAAGCDLSLPGCSACVNALADLTDNLNSTPQSAANEPLNIIATAVAGVTARATANILTASPTTAARLAIAGQIK